jgi:hypothetical protein
MTNPLAPPGHRESGLDPATLLPPPETATDGMRALWPWVQSVVRASRRGAISTRTSPNGGWVPYSVLLSNTAPYKIVGRDDADTLQVILYNPGTIPVTFGADGGIVPADANGITMNPSAPAFTIPTCGEVWAVAAGTAAAPGIAGAIIVQRAGR